MQNLNAPTFSIIPLGKVGNISYLSKAKSA